MTKSNFHITLPGITLQNCEGGTLFKRQISQKIFTYEFMLPDNKKYFDALIIMIMFSFWTCLETWW